MALTGKLTLTSPTQGAEIRYSLDGSEPTPKSAIYTSAFKIGKADIRAKSFKNGLLPSEEASYSKDFIYEKYVSDTLRFREKNIIIISPTEDDLFKLKVEEITLFDSDTVRHSEPAKKVEANISGCQQIRIKLIDIDKNKSWDHFVIGDAYFTKKDGSIVFLSDLAINFTDLLRRDISIDKNPLQVAKKVFRKGLGIHAPAEIWCTFKTDEFVKFSGFFGTDDETNGWGSSKASLVIKGVRK